MGFLICCLSCFLFCFVFSVYLLPDDEGVGVGILEAILGIMDVGAETKNPPYKIVLGNKHIHIPFQSRNFQSTKKESVIVQENHLRFHFFSLTSRKFHVALVVTF